MEKLFADYKKDFIVQEFLYQHNFFHQMHRDSLNTIRIISLRLNGSIHILSRVVRMGNDGSFTDNAESGCITCGLTKKENFNLMQPIIGRMKDMKSIRIVILHLK